MAIVSGYEYDIFISYRHNDNRSGWVTEFVKNLHEELSATIKEPVSVYFDSNPHDGLLETHNVDKSLEGKLKCLIFIPIISKTYCDPKSFAWQHEFCMFNKLAKEDQFGRDIKLSNGNIASRILQIKIHEIDEGDKSIIESEIGGALRSIEFIYKSPGVNRPLTPYDKKEDNINKTFYRDQVNKVANAIKGLIQGIQRPVSPESIPERKPGPSKRIKLSRLAIALALLAVSCYLAYSALNLFKESPPNLEKSVAVLPFDDLSPNHDQEYFSVGITDQILNHLTKIGELDVSPRTSSTKFKGSNKSIREIGKELEVAYVVEGSVMKDGGRVRINVKLIRAKDDRQIWSENYDRELTSIFVIQSDVAEQVANMLNANVSPKVKERLKSEPTKNMEAYNLLLQANFFSDPEKAYSFVEQALVLDSKYVDAYALLAQLWLVDGSSWGRKEGILAASKARELLRKALELDAENVNVHHALVRLYLWFDWDFKAVEKEFELIQKITPNANRSSEFLLSSGRLEEALKIIEEEQKDKGPSGDLMMVLYLLGRPGQAIDAANRYVASSIPFFYNDCIASRIYLYTGDYPKAAGLLEQTLNKYSFTRIPLYKSYLASAYYLNGQIEKSDQILNELKEKSGSSAGCPSYSLAISYATRGDADAAFQWLEKAYLNREMEMYWLKQEPAFKNLGTDKRWSSMLEKVGFPK